MRGNINKFTATGMIAILSIVLCCLSCPGILAQVNGSSESVFGEVNKPLTLSCGPEASNDSSFLFWRIITEVESIDILTYVFGTQVVTFRDGRTRCSPESRCSFNTSTYSLTINSLSISDHGTYRCSDSAPNTFRHTVEVITLVPPSSVTLSVASEVVENSNVPVTCSSTPVYPASSDSTFTLLLDNSPLSVESESETNENEGVTYRATVKLSRSQSNREITCQIVWRQGTSLETTITSDPTRVNVLCLPQPVCGCACGSRLSILVLSVLLALAVIVCTILIIQLIRTRNMLTKQNRSTSRDSSHICENQISINPPALEGHTLPHESNYKELHHRYAPADQKEKEYGNIVMYRNNINQYYRPYTLEQQDITVY